MATVTISAQSISAKEKEMVRRQYIAFCKELNEQLPVDVDEITTLNSVVFANWTMAFNYRITIDADDLSPNDIKEARNDIKAAFKEMALKMLLSGSYDISRSSFKALMRVTGFKFRATYRDMFNKFLFSVVLDYNDF